MAICPEVCAPELPPAYNAGCGIVTRPGGIQKVGFVKCDYTFIDITDTLEWETAIAAGDIVVSGLILGQKPKGSFTKKRLSSCSPEAVVGGEKTMTFQDYNTDTVTPGGTGLYTFWNTILLEPQSYQMFYYTCDKYVYGLLSDFQLEIDEITEDNSTGNTFLDGILSWNQIGLTVPVAVDLSGII